MQKKYVNNRLHVNGFDMYFLFYIFTRKHVLRVICFLHVKNTCKTCLHVKHWYMYFFTGNHSFTCKKIHMGFNVVLETGLNVITNVASICWPVVTWLWGIQITSKSIFGENDKCSLEPKIWLPEFLVEASSSIWIWIFIFRGQKIKYYWKTVDNNPKIFYMFPPQVWRLE